MVEASAGLRPSITASLLFRGGTVVEEYGTKEDDLLVTEGKIVQRSLGIDCPRGFTEIDCSGRLLLPGLIDVHVHLELQVAGIRTADDFASGTRSAAVGGVTTVADFVDQEADASLTSIVESRWEYCGQSAVVDWTNHIVISQWNSSVAEDMRELAERGLARSVKLFTTYKSRGLYSDDEQFRQVLEETNKAGFVVFVHAENDKTVTHLTRKWKKRRPGAIGLSYSRPAAAEEEAIERVLALAESTGGKIHLVHISSAGSAVKLADARKRMLWASGETCPQYLTLTEERLKGHEGHLYAVCPPLRPRKHSIALWDALTSGDVQVIATDSCGFSREDKNRWGGDFTAVLCGLPGVETSFRLMYSHGVKQGKIGLSRLVQLMSSNPARLLGIYPRKGNLDVGSDADIVVLDDDTEVELTADGIVSNTAWSPYLGWKLARPPHSVYLRGSLVAHKGRFVGSPGSGLALSRGVPELPV